MTDAVLRLSLVIDRALATGAERGLERWTAQIEPLLSEARPLLADGVDTARLASFVIATLEGALLMPRADLEVAARQDIAADLKRFVAYHLRHAANAS